MAHKAKKANWENHTRQMFFLDQGVIMLPKKSILAKSKHKRLMMAKRKALAEGAGKVGNRFGFRRKKAMA